MASKLLLSNPAKHYMVSSKAPHEYIITNEKKVSRAILVGVSMYYASDRIFYRYLDTETGCEVISDIPEDFELCVHIPWLELDGPGEPIRIPVKYSQYDGKKTMRFKIDTVFAVNQGTIPSQYLVEVYRGKRDSAFHKSDNVRATAHFVIF